MDRGVSGQSLSAPDQHAEKDSIIGGIIALGTDGLPLPAPLPARHPGLLQPQGVGFKSGTTQAGVLCLAEILQGNRARQITNCQQITLACGPEIPSAKPSGWPPASPRSISWDRL